MRKIINRSNSFAKIISGMLLGVLLSLIQLPNGFAEELNSEEGIDPTLKNEMIFRNLATKSFHELKVLDFNHDDQIDVADVEYFEAHWDTLMESPSLDLNIDGYVDHQDIRLLSLLVGDSFFFGAKLELPKGWGILDSNQDGKVNVDDYRIVIEEEDAFAPILDAKSFSKVKKLGWNAYFAPMPEMNVGMIGSYGLSPDEWSKIIVPTGLFLCLIQSERQPTSLKPDKTKNSPADRYWSFSFSSGKKREGFQVAQIVYSIASQRISLHFSQGTQPNFTKRDKIILPDFILSPISGKLHPKEEGENLSSLDNVHGNNLKITEVFFKGLNWLMGFGATPAFANGMDIATLMDKVAVTSAIQKGNKVNKEASEIISHLNATLEKIKAEISRNPDCLELKCSNVGAAVRLMEQLEEALNSAFDASEVNSQYLMQMYKSELQSYKNLKQNIKWRTRAYAVAEGFSGLNDLASFDFGRYGSRISKAYGTGKLGSGSELFGDIVGNVAFKSLFESLAKNKGFADGVGVNALGMYTKKVTEFLVQEYGPEIKANGYDINKIGSEIAGGILSTILEAQASGEPITFKNLKGGLVLAVVNSVFRAIVKKQQKERKGSIEHMKGLINASMLRQLDLKPTLIRANELEGEIFKFRTTTKNINNAFTPIIGPCNEAKRNAKQSKCKAGLSEALANAEKEYNDGFSKASAKLRSAERTFADKTKELRSLKEKLMDNMKKIAGLELSLRNARLKSKSDMNQERIWEVERRLERYEGMLNGAMRALARGRLSHETLDDFQKRKERLQTHKERLTKGLSSGKKALAQLKTQQNELSAALGGTQAGNNKDADAMIDKKYELRKKNLNIQKILRDKFPGAAGGHPSFYKTYRKAEKTFDTQKAKLEKAYEANKENAYKALRACLKAANVSAASGRTVTRGNSGGMKTYAEIAPLMKKVSALHGDLLTALSRIELKAIKKNNDKCEEEPVPVVRETDEEIVLLLVTPFGGNNPFNPEDPVDNGGVLVTQVSTVTPPAVIVPPVVGADVTPPTVNAPTRLNLYLLTNYVPARPGEVVGNANGVPVTDQLVQAFLNGVTATDNVGVVGSITHNAPTTFFPVLPNTPFGKDTLVTFRAMDAAGNVGTAVTTVNVTDVEGPVLIPNNCPFIAAHVPLGTASASVNDPTIQAMITCAKGSWIDNVDGVIPPAQVTFFGAGLSPAPVVFPVGFTPVEYQATDKAGNNGLLRNGIQVLSP